MPFRDVTFVESRFWVDHIPGLPIAMGLIAMTFRHRAIARMLAGSGSWEDSRLKAKSGTTQSAAARRNRRVTTSLLFLSRYDLYCAIRSAADINIFEAVDAILLAPTLTTT